MGADKIFEIQRRYQSVVMFIRRKAPARTEGTGTEILQSILQYSAVASSSEEITIESKKGRKNGIMMAYTNFMAL